MIAQSQVIHDASYIKSVEIHNSEQEHHEFVFRLNESFVFEFDDVSENQQNYHYNIKHCDVNWEVSNLFSTDYIEGMESFQIQDFQGSFGTLNFYTHYKFTLPNENTRITRTGNYLIEITNDDDEIVLSRKVILYKSKAIIGLTVTESNDLSFFNQKQLVNLTVNTQAITTNFPKKEIKTIVFQNNNIGVNSGWLDATYVNNDLLTYRNINSLDFYGGNEFLYFENIELFVNTNTIYDFYREDNTYNTILNYTTPRHFKKYRYNPDINGDFRVRRLNNTNPETEAEYSYVYFTLRNSPEFQDKEVYIYGAFNNYQLSEENLMTYETDTKNHTGFIKFKQGFYNYLYVIKDKTGKLDFHSIEGSHFDTENDYSTLVYLTPMNSFYYEVVGYQKTNSKQVLAN